MDIRKYLPFYLGCDCVVDLSRYLAGTGIKYDISRVPAVFDSINRSKDIDQCWGVSVKDEDGFAFLDVFNQHCRYFDHFVHSDQLKLILRTLPMLTREEIEHVLWLVMDSDVHLDADSGVDQQEAAGSIDSIDPDDNAVVVNFSLRCFVGKLYLSEHSGLVRLYDEDDVEQPIEFNPELVWYLISRKIDLFGLIKAGLAERAE